MNYRNVKISQDARIAKWKRYQLGVILLEYGIQIQFHTQESFDVKMSEEDHKLYEQRRVLEPGCDEYNRILQLQLKLYSDMEYPENIADLEKI